MKINMTKSRRWIALGALGALAATNAAMFTTPAQAAPYQEVAYGHHNRGDRRRNEQETFTGRVTDVHSNQSFDIRADSQTFNVYSNVRLPRRLNKGDRVQVVGDRSGKNDIRNASVTILRNR